VQDQLGAVVPAEPGSAAHPIVVLEEHQHHSGMPEDEHLGAQERYVDSVRWHHHCEAVVVLI
jgi:hypothetical protein